MIGDLGNKRLNQKRDCVYNGVYVFIYIVFSLMYCVCPVAL